MCQIRIGMRVWLWFGVIARGWQCGGTLTSILVSVRLQIWGSSALIWLSMSEPTLGGIPTWCSTTYSSWCHIWMYVFYPNIKPLTRTLVLQKPLLDSELIFVSHLLPWVEGIPLPPWFQCPRGASARAQSWVSDQASCSLQMGLVGEMSQCQRYWGRGCFTS